MSQVAVSILALSVRHGCLALIPGFEHVGRTIVHLGSLVWQLFSGASWGMRSKVCAAVSNPRASDEVSETQQLPVVHVMQGSQDQPHVKPLRSHTTYKNDGLGSQCYGSLSDHNPETILLAPGGPPKAKLGPQPSFSRVRPMAFA